MGYLSSAMVFILLLNPSSSCQAELKLHNLFFPFNPSSPDFALNGPHLYPSLRRCLCRPAKKNAYVVAISPRRSRKGWMQCAGIRKRKRILQLKVIATEFLCSNAKHVSYF